MNTYKVIHDGERLDTICLRFYGTLHCFSELLVFNSSLNAVLQRGDIVKLPKLEIQSEKGNELW